MKGSERCNNSHLTKKKSCRIVTVIPKELELRHIFKTSISYCHVLTFSYSDVDIAWFPLRLF